MYFTNRSSDTLSDSSVRPDGLKGADAPEERLVKKMKKVAPWTIPQFVALNKVIDEFPWLWRLEGDWVSVNCQCVVIDPAPRIFREKTELHLDYWVHGLTPSGNMAVRHTLISTQINRSNWNNTWHSAHL
jgi:hypothetical protein